MDRIRRTVEAILDRHPAPAMSSKELREALRRELNHTVPDDVRMLRSLESGSDAVRVVWRPRRKWRQQLGPRAWVVGLAPGRRRPTRFPSPLRRLTSTLRTVGRHVEATSIRTWARWTRMMEEDGQVRAALRNRVGNPPGRPRSAQPSGSPDEPSSRNAPLHH